jgi:hypothetical protein
MGADRERGGLAGGDNARPSPPSVPEYGLNCDELYEYQREFTEYAAERLLGVGRDQYDEGASQKFEDMRLSELLIGLREELADVVNYATMIDVILTRWYVKADANA